MKFEPTKIEIRTINGLMKIAALRGGAFAVHRRVVDEGIEGVDWTITHVPSGINVGRYFTHENQALGAASEIAGLRDDWESGFDPRLVTRKFLRLVNEVFRRHGGYEVKTGDEEYDRSLKERAVQEYAIDLNGYVKQ